MVPASNPATFQRMEKNLQFLAALSGDLNTVQYMQKWFHVHINFLSTRLLKAAIKPFHGPQRVDIEEEPISSTVVPQGTQ